MQNSHNIFVSDSKATGDKNDSGLFTQELYNHAKGRIPGGTQLLSKRPEMYAPEQWPAYFKKARGCEIWDIDGRHYYDMSTNAVGACLLGYNDEDVSQAVINCINNGSMCSLNAPEEVELADILCEIHPWAEQVRFARGGGEAAAVAVRIARAATDRSIVAVCGYHGWHDWYLAANLGKNDSLRGHLLPGLDPVGVPRELRGTTFPFKYNDRDEFLSVVKEHGKNLAAVIMETCRNCDPDPGFLEMVRDSVRECGALLIFDEISIGWRLNFGGAHLKFGINPDIAVFAKALGNGHPIGAVIGTCKAMEGANKSFISSTYWTESIGSVAALATLKKMKEIDIPSYVARAGKKILHYWESSAKKYGLSINSSKCYPCLAHFSFNYPNGEALRTLYTQMMLERGFLAGIGIYPSLAHTDEIVSLYGNAIDEVYEKIANAISDNSVNRLLKGSVAHSGFKRLV